MKGKWVTSGSTWPKLGTAGDPQAPSIGRLPPKERFSHQLVPSRYHPTTSSGASRLTWVCGRSRTGADGRSCHLAQRHLTCSVSSYGQTVPDLPPTSSPSRKAKIAGKQLSVRTARRSSQQPCGCSNVSTAVACALRERGGARWEDARVPKWKGCRRGTDQVQRKPEGISILHMF